MKLPVSIVIPSLFDAELFERSLPPLLAELERRDAGDEVLVVDDSGDGSIEPWMTRHFPSVEVLTRAENGGYGPALLDGVERARHGLVFCMNPDVVVRTRFLEPLVEALEDDDVHSAVPRILLHGDEARIESVTEIRFRHDLAEVGQPGLEERAGEFEAHVRPVAYGIGGACLLRRDPFVESGGCDPLFAPFYWEDVDVGWRAWRAGQRVLYVPKSVVEHHHRGTIRSRVNERVVRAMIEKNRLLFQWKHLDSPELVERHVASLYRWAVDAWLQDEREELIWLALALDQLDEVRDARAALPPSKRSFEEIREASATDRD